MVNKTALCLPMFYVSCIFMILRSILFIVIIIKSQIKTVLCLLIFLFIMSSTLYSMDEMDDARPCLSFYLSILNPCPWWLWLCERALRGPLGLDTHKSQQPGPPGRGKTDKSGDWWIFQASSQSHHTHLMDPRRIKRREKPARAQNWCIRLSIKLIRAK